MWPFLGGLRQPTQPNTKKNKQGKHHERPVFSNTQQIRKPARDLKGRYRRRAIAPRPPRSAPAVLAASGDCIDAVIATTFALGVLGALDERPRRRRGPWCSIARAARTVMR